MAAFQKFFVLTILSLTALQACTYREDKSKPNSAGPGSFVAADFTQIQQSIIEPKCATCHGNQQPAANLSLKTYAQIKALVVPGNPRGSTLYLITQNGEMPKNAPRLSETELDAIFKWIENGAHREKIEGVITNPNPTATPDATPIVAPSATPIVITPGLTTFALVQKSIIEPKCAGCHGSQNAAAV